MQLVQLFCINDAGAIYFREFPFQKADVVGGGKQAAQVGLIAVSYTHLKKEFLEPSLSRLSPPHQRSWSLHVSYLSLIHI